MAPALAFRDVLDQREWDVVARVLRALEASGTKEGRTGVVYVREGLGRLRGLWQAIDAYPRIQERQTLGSRRRDLNTLLDSFAQIEPYTMESVLPTRAALGRAYGMAKFNFCRMVTYVAEEHIEKSDDAAELIAEMRAAGRAAAAAVIAEDVLRSIACDTKLEGPFRRRATRILAALWDQRATQSLADFAPLLDSAWRAKANVKIGYGTLVGLSELFQMLNSGVDSEFIDYFANERATPEQFGAFEEFLFNATYEQLQRMRAYMTDSCRSSLDTAEVARLFGLEPDMLHTTTVSPRDMFFTFREREMAARCRRVAGLEGPKKTAEEYVMIYVLGRLDEARAEAASAG